MEDAAEIAAKAMQQGTERISVIDGVEVFTQDADFDLDDDLYIQLHFLLIILLFVLLYSYTFHFIQIYTVGQRLLGVRAKEIYSRPSGVVLAYMELFQLVP